MTAEQGVNNHILCHQFRCSLQQQPVCLPVMDLITSTVRRQPGGSTSCCHGSLRPYASHRAASVHVSPIVAFRPSTALLPSSTCALYHRT